MLDILDHIGFPVTDYKRSLNFYTKALAPLGIVLLREVKFSEEEDDGYAGFGRERPQFWLGTDGAEGLTARRIFRSKPGGSASLLRCGDCRGRQGQRGAWP